MRISDWSSDVCSSDLVRCWQCLAQHGVALARAFVGPGEDIAQQFDSIELIHAEGALDVQVVRHVHERQRRQVVANQWNIGSQSRSTLVDVVERLQVRQLPHREERLLERRSEEHTSELKSLLRIS